MESGGLRPGDVLPGIRKVAEELVVNPNTVAKAYREMEHLGLVVLRHGAGAYIAGETPAPEISRAIAEGRAAMAETVAHLRRLGLEEGVIRRLLESELVSAEVRK